MISKGIDWTKVDLGKKPDSEIAREKNVSVGYISYIRKKMGIKAFVGLLLTQEGNGCRSIYEAMYDCYLHWKGISHKHEVKVVNLPYIADFEINNQYIEIFGMIGFSKYEKRVNKKILNYKKNNVNYIEVKCDEIEKLYKDCPIKVICKYQRKCSICGKETRKILKGYCKKCYMDIYRYKISEERECLICHKKYRNCRDNSKYCSLKCYHKSLNKTEWPSDECLEKELKIKSYEEIAKNLNVTIRCLQCRLSRIRKKNNKEKIYLTKRIPLNVFHPELEKEWHKTKNTDIMNYSYGSNKKAWWICAKGHEWEAVINSRSQGAGCPYCGGQKITKDKSILYTCPELAKEWDYEKNKGIDIKTISKGSGKKVWWKCKNGHSWMAVVGSRSKGRNCPICYKEIMVRRNNYEFNK